jgi:hypothetical protein
MSCSIGNLSAKRVSLAAVLVLMTSIFGSCQLGSPTEAKPRCGFGDVEVAVPLALCDIVANYYVTRRRWPSARKEIEEEARKLLLGEPTPLSSEEEEELNKFFGSFSVLRLRVKANNLALRFQFVADGKVIRRSVVLKPGVSSEQILETMELRRW